MVASLVFFTCLSWFGTFALPISEGEGDQEPTINVSYPRKSFYPSSGGWVKEDSPLPLVLTSLEFSFGNAWLGEMRNSGYCCSWLGIKGGEVTLYSWLYPMGVEFPSY